MDYFEEQLEKILNIKTSAIEKMSPDKRKRYFEILHDYCEIISKGITPKIKPLQNLIGQHQQHFQSVVKDEDIILRNSNDELLPDNKEKKKHYDVKIIGLDNIPNDGCIIASNHTCKDDAITLNGIAHQKGIPSIILGARDGISQLATFLVNQINVLLFDRTDAKEARDASYMFDANALAGYACFILPEATWCFHLTERVLNMWPGVIKSSAVTEKPIIPIIVEYVEVPYPVKKMEDLYSTCVIKIGKPFCVRREDKVFDQLDSLKNSMIQMREEIQEEHYGKVIRHKSELTQEDIEKYINHAWVRAYSSWVPYNNDNELNRIFVRSGEKAVNMFHIGENGEIEPGTIPKGKRKTPPFYTV